jgi:ferredoxin-type protein NapF
LQGRIGVARAGRAWPPWAHPSSFTETCSRCLDCALACQERIIVPGDGGFPEVDFKRGECIFCEDCVNACKTGALSLRVDPPWMLKAQVDERCLSMKGVTCRSCGDVCDTRAIRFQLQVGGRADLTIYTENCTGCGACVGVCPVQAVTVVSEIKSESVTPSGVAANQEELA